MNALNFNRKLCSTLFTATASISSNSIIINSKYNAKCDSSVNTYPANNPTEDRFVVKESTKTSKWYVGAVFDGHGIRIT